MKKIISVLVVISLFVLCSCGNNNKKEDNKEEVNATVSMFDLRTAMLAADDTFPKMLSVSDSDDNAEDLFKYISEDFEYNRIEKFFLSYSSDSSNPSGEIVVIALKDTADADAAIKALKSHVEHRIKMYEEYDPDSVSKVKGAVVFSKAQYVVLIIAEKADVVKTAFEEFINN